MTRIRHFLRHWIPPRVPYMSRAHFPRELRAWALIAVALGAVEGQVGGVIIKTLYADTASPLLLNQAVAVVAGAPAFSNLLSFFWSALSHGRDKVRVLVTLQGACAASFLLVAAAPVSGAGLWLIIAGFVTARMFWAGIVTVRSAIWRANYPRNARANVTGRIAVLSSLLMAITGISVGLSLETAPWAFRIAYPVAALCCLLAAWQYRGVRMRHQHISLKTERTASGAGHGHALGGMLEILGRDHSFRRYMINMAVFGSGNLMLPAVLIVVLNEHAAMPPLEQVLITSSLPLAMIPLAVPVWARLLDRMHVVSFRAIQSWSFPVAMVCMAGAALLPAHWLYWPGAVFLGVGYAGGILGWNLGHNDFASREQTARYMGVHVTLTGVRGLVAPLAGVWVYQLLEVLAPGSGPWALCLPLLLSAAGAAGFVHMHRYLRLTLTAEPTAASR